MARRIPCDKFCWKKKQAKALVLAAAYYRHNTNRRERDYYYCTLCNAWHTTSDEPPHRNPRKHDNLRQIQSNKNRPSRRGRPAD